MVNAIMGQFFFSNAGHSCFLQNSYSENTYRRKNIAYTFARSIDNLY